MSLELLKQWTADYLKSPPELPEGVYDINGTLMVDCCCCGRPSELPCDVSELPMEGYEHYCGRSPMCCP